MNVAFTRHVASAAAILGAAGLSGLSWTLPAAGAALPAGPDPKPAAELALRACSQQGEGFFSLPGSDTCLRIGGMARMDAVATSPPADQASSRYGMAVTGRISADARTASDWGMVRTFVQFELGSLTGASYSDDKARLGAGFDATGVDTMGKAQKVADLYRAFVQFRGLTAGRSSSFFDFYKHEVELAESTPTSDAPPVDLLAWTFGLGDGLSLTMSAEQSLWRRRPVAYSAAVNADGSPAPDGWKPGAAPVALVPLGTDAAGRPVYGRMDVRQRNNVPDLVTALRLERPWGALQLSGALRQIDVNGAMWTPSGPDAGVSRPAAHYGGAIQAGVMVNLPALGDGDRLWAQAAWGRGALSYTGAAPLGFDNLNGSPSGRKVAWAADARVGPDGQLHLSDSWSVVAALQHYWLPTVAQSVFAGYARVNYGDGTTAGMGVADGFPGPIPGNVLEAVGTRIDWEPVKDLAFSGEVSWTRVRNRDGAGLTRAIAWTPSRDSSWSANLRIERNF